MSDSQPLDLVEMCQRYDLNPTKRNEVSGVITHVTVKEMEGKYGPYQKASIKLELSLPIAPGRFEKVIGWFSIFDSKFKGAGPKAFEKHLQGFRDRIGHCYEFLINNLSFSEGTSRNGQKEITVNIEWLAIPFALIITGGVSDEETPEPVEEVAPARAPRMQLSTAFGRPGTPAF